MTTPSALGGPSDTGSNTQEPGPSTGLRRNRLGAFSIGTIVVSAVAPVSGLAAGSPVVFAINGASAPAAFLLAAGLFTLFAVGYVAMSRHMTNAGGFVAYIAKGFGTRAATASAAVTLLFYLALTVAFYALSGVVIASTFGTDIPVAIVTFVLLAVVGVVGYFGIGISLRLLVILLGLEVVAVVVVDIALAFRGGPDGLSLDGFLPSNVAGPGIGVALLVSIVCYTGLEATVVMSEEARTPHRTIPRAVYGALAFIAAMYTITTWLLSVAAGPDQVQAAAAANPGGFFFAIAGSAVSAWFGKVLEILVVTSFIALFIGFQSLVARYVFALDE